MRVRRMWSGITALTMLVSACLSLLTCPAEAYAAAAIYNVEAREDWYHYGCSGYIATEPSAPVVQYQKVKSIYASKTDMSSWTELGLTYDYGYSNARIFVARCSNGAYKDYVFDSVPWGTTTRFHIGYSTADQKFYYWLNNAVFMTIPKSEVGGMTSCWPGTNAEVDLWNSSAAYNNDAYFSGLMYKEYNWGVWTYWGTSGQNFYDNDPNNSNHFGNNYVSVY
ncbi:MAG: hypothetical protein ISP10_08610 [Aeromicrobium sp.]|nr:hypothetical protein [Aeromicrobium sp.]